VRFTELEDLEAGIALPQMVFQSRADDLIDIAGFTRVSERSISQALAASSLRYEDWVARKETIRGKPLLHLYLELNAGQETENIESVFHRCLSQVDPGYRDLSTMMNIYPLEVTLLKQGSFSSFSRIRHIQGLELAQQKPRRMNACEEEIQELLGRPVAKAVTSR
jgi:hypothetical protein